MSHSGGPRRPLGMNIAIAGGTGTLGRQVAEELRARGHEARVLSRSAPEYRVDLTTGAGLDKALDGCEVVIDASNNSSSSAAATLVEGTRRLLAAGRDAGIAHHVCMSVVGCELVPMGYFQVKAQQEDLVARAIADVACKPPRHGRVSVAGPEVASARELAWRWREATGKRTLLVQVPLPGRLGRALRGGALTASHPDVRGGVTFAAWLAETQR
jgi:uncharacterized protein YbjT (DUF2867 family)